MQYADVIATLALVLGIIQTINGWQARKGNGKHRKWG